MKFRRTKPGNANETLNNDKPKQRKRGTIILALAIMGLIAGFYILSIPIAPKFANNNAEQAVESEPEDDRIIIKSADINTPIFEGGAEALNQGAWHRFPERGDPQKGGNFIVTGHRFVMTGSHRETMTQSRFYNIDKIKEGDEILVHWHGKKYQYKVARKYTVDPHQVEIEEPSKEAKITVYTCTLGGTYDGREVIEAVPVY